MGTVTVTTDLINSPQAQDYFTRADRRIMIGLRTALEMLGIPVPEYAQRRMPWQSTAQTARAAYDADNPAPRSTTLAERRPNATPERVAVVQAANQARLYDQVFPG